MAASDETIREAARRLAEAASSRPARVILFGSYAHGQVDEESDLDFLVVEPELRGRRAETVRLRRVLRDLEVPVDLLVVSEEQFRELAGIPGTVVHEAATAGRALVGA